jgi:hypothetical protein
MGQKQIYGDFWFGTLTVEAVRQCRSGISTAISAVGGVSELYRIEAADGGYDFLGTSGTTKICIN